MRPAISDIGVRSGSVLVSDCRHADRHQRLGLLSIRRQVQIREQYLAARQSFTLRDERLFYLYDQLGAAKYSVAVGYDLRASSLIIAIRKSCACSSLAFHYNSMSLIGEFSHGRRHDTDAVLVILALLARRPAWRSFPSMWEASGPIIGTPRLRKINAGQA
jgi:hypothetical protein